MSSGNSDSVFSSYPETLAIPAGTTAVISALPGQINAILKWGSGGTLIIVGASLAVGSTFSIAQEYIVGTAEAVSMDLRGSVSLLASGTTSVCYLLRSRSAL